MKIIKFSFWRFAFLALGAAIILFAFCFSSEAATLYLLPSSQSVYQGETMLLEVRLNTEGEEINAAEVKINFPQEIFQAVDTNRGNSIFSLWVQEPVISFGQGEVSFAGGVPNGFRGDGLLASFILGASSLGSANVNFDQSSQVFLNDGKGTAANLVFLEGSYEVIKPEANLPKILCATHPDQNKWFRSPVIHLHWDLIEGAQYSFQLSKDPLSEPDTIADRPAGELKWIGDMEYAAVEDGIWYFSLRQKLPGADWSKKISYRVMVDSTPPEPFKLEIGKDPSMFDGKYFLSFSATDKSSGIDHYEVFEERKKTFGKEIAAKWQRVASPYVLKDQELKSIIRVKAIDRAGNERIEELLLPAKPFPYWVLGLILLGVAIIALFFAIIRKRRKQAKSQ